MSVSARVRFPAQRDPDGFMTCRPKYAGTRKGLGLCDPSGKARDVMHKTEALVVGR